MSDTTLTISDLDDEEIVAVLGGLCTFQMKAFSAGNIPKVAAAGNALGKLAEENPDPVREAFLQNRDAFQVAQMPEEMLDHLDLEVRDGKLHRPDGDDGWTEVEVE